MTHREELQEKYEDALFALLMDDLAKTQGEAYEAENERLKDDTEFVVPDKTDQRMLKAIHRSFFIQHYQKVRQFSIKTLSRVSVAIVAILLLSVTAVALSPSLKTYVLTTLVEHFPESTDFVVSTEDSAIFAYNSILGINLGYFPDNYTLISEQQEDTFLSNSYEDLNGNTIDISVSIGVGVTSIDTENAEVSDITVQGCEGIAVDKAGDFHAIAWVDTNHNCKVVIFASTLTTEELLPIAEGLEIIQ